MSKLLKVTLEMAIEVRFGRTFLSFSKVEVAVT